MNRSFIALLILLFLSGCGPEKKNRYFAFPAKKAQPLNRYQRAKTKPNVDTTSRTGTFDEELDGFILLDDFDEELSFKDGLDVGSYQDVYLDEDDEIAFVDDREVDLYNFKTAYYDFDKFVIRPDQRPIFMHNLKAIRKALHDGKTVVIEGHADNAAGTRAYSLQLSQQRAQTAADWLIERGISPDSLKIIGRGSEMLIVPSGDKNEQAPNRRVEIYTISS